MSLTGFITRCAGITLTAGFLAGCAYAPAGTLVGALDASDFSSSNVAAAPSQYEQANRNIDTPSGVGDEPLPGQSGVGVTPTEGTDGLADAPGSTTPNLMSFDEAEETRARLQDLARTQGTRGVARPGTSLERLKALGENHDDQARRDIEGSVRGGGDAQ